MKWLPEECKPGDMVRVKLGSIYHYGIYVSDSEVIQFGLPPIAGLKIDDNSIVVCTTSIAEFACEQFVEVAVFDRTERKKANKPADVIAKAKSRLGQGGYNLLHNNCEHFVNECVFNTAYSEQESLARKKWQERDLVAVFVAAVPQGENYDVDTVTLYPEERKREVLKVKHLPLRQEKIAAWQLLEIGLNCSYSIGLKEAEPYCSFGKWKSKKCYFSISHSHGLVTVALSNAPVGVDLETNAEFEEKLQLRGKERLLKKICTIKEAQQSGLVPIELWTRKESLFKLKGKGIFIPSQIESQTKEVRTYYQQLNEKEYCLSVATELCVEPIVTVKELTNRS